ncbi:MAG: hypothetical protein IT359_18830 [Gemmatimonadaceae bacterium]|nr:hypothetical protein [Gemmatimonadaceae bacterium]
MVITLYADRRTLDIADIAGRLARALASRLPAPGAVVATTKPGGGEARLRLGGVPHASFPPGATPAEIVVALQRLAAQYPATIVAWSGAPTEQALAACDSSQRVLLVSDPSVASIRGTQRALKLCSSLGYDAGKVGVVLHGFDADAPLGPRDAADVLKREIFWILPGERDRERDKAFEGLAERLSQQAPSR